MLLQMHISKSFTFLQVEIESAGALVGRATPAEDVVLAIAEVVLEVVVVAVEVTIDVVTDVVDAKNWS